MFAISRKIKIRSNFRECFFFSCVLWDCTRVLLGGSFGTLFFWDLKENTSIATMHAHTGKHNQLKLILNNFFMNHRKWKSDLINVVILWVFFHVENTVFTNFILDAISTIHCNEDGSLVITGGEDRRVVIWKTA